jgi:hypothetical protein
MYSNELNVYIFPLNPMKKASQAFLPVMDCRMVQAQKVVIGCAGCI